MKIKKYLGMVAITTASVCVLWLLSRIVFFVVFLYVDRWAWAAEYQEYATEFNLVKDYVAENYPSEEERWLDVTSTLNEHGRTLYEYDTKVYAELPTEVQAALDTIEENAFSSHAYLNTIRIRGNRVDFCTQVGYALVYSPDEKPTWMHIANDPTNIRVKKIGDGWYHVKKK